MSKARCGLLVLGVLLVTVFAGCGGGGGGGGLGSLGLPFYTPPENVLLNNDREAWNAMAASEGVLNAADIGIPAWDNIDDELLGMLPWAVQEALNHFMNTNQVASRGVPAALWLALQAQQFAQGEATMNTAQGSNTWTDSEGRTWTFSGTETETSGSFTLVGTGTHTNITATGRMVETANSVSAQLTCNGTITYMGLAQAGSSRNTVNMSVSVNAQSGSNSGSFTYTENDRRLSDSLIGSTWTRVHTYGSAGSGNGSLSASTGTINGTFEKTYSMAVYGMAVGQMTAPQGFLWANSSGNFRTAYELNQWDQWVIDAIPSLTSNTSFGDRYSATFNITNDVLSGSLRTPAGTVVGNYTGNLWSNARFDWVADDREDMLVNWWN
jgi:hypothetical protein